MIYRNYICSLGDSTFGPPMFFTELPGRILFTIIHRSSNVCHLLIVFKHYNPYEMDVPNANEITLIEAKEGYLKVSV